MYQQNPQNLGFDATIYKLYPPPKPQEPPPRPGEKGYLSGMAGRAAEARKGLPTPEELAAAWDKVKEKRNESVRQ